MIDIFAANFTASEFPGSTGVNQATIDRFVNLSDSLVIPAIRNDQKVYAQYYNKMVNSLNAIEQYIYIESSVSSCPLSGLQLHATGNVDDIGAPEFYSFPLSDLLGYAHSTHSTSFSGQVLPFELIIVPNSGHNFGNIWKKSSFLIESEPLWDKISRGAMCVLNLSPLDSNVKLVANAVSTTAPYTNGYINYLSLIHSQIDGAGYFGVRGFIVDHYGPRSHTEWLNKAANVKLVLSVLEEI